MFIELVRTFHKNFQIMLKQGPHSLNLPVCNLAMLLTRYKTVRLCPKKEYKIDKARNKNKGTLSIWYSNADTLIAITEIKPKKLQ